MNLFSQGRGIRVGYYCLFPTPIFKIWRTFTSFMSAKSWARFFLLGNVGCLQCQPHGTAGFPGEVFLLWSPHPAQATQCDNGCLLPRPLGDMWSDLRTTRLLIVGYSPHKVIEISVCCWSKVEVGNHSPDNPGVLLLQPLGSHLNGQFACDILP